MKHLYVSSIDGTIIADNLTDKCKECLDTCETIGKIVPDCKIYGDNRRNGIIKTSKSITFLCCNSTKTTKLFREKLEALSYAYPELNIPRKEIESEIKKEEQIKVNRLIHNLTSINAHNIQEIYDLVPQEVLSNNWRQQLDFIEKEIIESPDKAAMMFLRIAKHNIHMKSEFSIYRKLDREDSIDLEIRQYSIRNVLLNVLHTFFSDFSANNIYVHVNDYFGKLNFDYETIQVAIYHMIENATKYAKPNSQIDIDFEEENDILIVSFTMLSIYVLKEERENVFKEGYSGINAKRMQKNGDGIGLWRIKQMMELNKGTCSVEFGDNIEKVMGFDFARNTFRLHFNIKY